MDAKKRKYTARVSFDKKEAEYLSYRYSPGQLVLWCVLAGKQSLGIWLIAPDFSSTDTFTSDAELSDCEGITYQVRIEEKGSN